VYFKVSSFFSYLPFSIVPFPKTGMSIDEQNKDVPFNFLKGQYTQKALLEKVKYVDNLEVSEIESFGTKSPAIKEDMEQ
jgi:hypothetical protein